MLYWIMIKSRKGANPKSPESVWVCEAAGQHLARKCPWWLHSCQRGTDQSSTVSLSLLHQASRWGPDYKPHSCSLSSPFSQLLHHCSPSSWPPTGCSLSKPHGNSISLPPTWLFSLTPRPTLHSCLSLVLNPDLLYDFISDFSHNEVHLPVFCRVYILSAAIPNWDKHHPGIQEALPTLAVPGVSMQSESCIFLALRW